MELPELTDEELHEIVKKHRDDECTIPLHARIRRQEKAIEKMLLIVKAVAETDPLCCTGDAGDNINCFLCNGTDDWGGRQEFKHTDDCQWVQACVLTGTEG